MGPNGFADYLKKELDQYGGIMVPVKAQKHEILLVRKAAVSRLHPNPDDEFSDPAIGPNYSIISDYIARYKRYGSMKKPEEIVEEPLMVQKVRPDGYMILNGHHRWAAFWSMGVKDAPVSIINLTMETDIRRMIEESKHDKRVTLDLDEVIFCSDGDPAEEHLGGLAGRRFKERIRLGVPRLLHFLSKQGYDIWVYTSEYYSMDYISDYFEKYSVKLDGIITGTRRRSMADPVEKKRLQKMISDRYTETLHIDRDAVIRTFSESKDFEEFRIEAGIYGWAQAMIDVFKGLK